MNKLDVLFSEYKKLWSQQEHYGALLRLAIINAQIGKSSNNNDDTSKWASKITIESIPEPVKLEINKSVKRDIDRAYRILSIGDQFTYEEILFVLTIVSNLEMLTVYLNGRCSFSIKPNLSIVIDAIKSHLGNSDFFQLYKSAVAQIKKSTKSDFDLFHRFPS